MNEKWEVPVVANTEIKEMMFLPRRLVVTGLLIQRLVVDEANTRKGEKKRKLKKNKINSEKSKAVPHEQLILVL